MKRFLLFIVALCSMLIGYAQSKNQAYLDYIDQYRSIAIQQQKKHGIPAAITLAQGLLESAAGRSELATKANNHFGIKCNSEWNGRTFTADDETKNECFRRYHSAEESYEDHSLFLLRKRYESLFQLSITDYKGWARGLKACGYATDPKYAEKLINLIELYDLQHITKGKNHGNNNPVIHDHETWEDLINESDVILRAHHSLKDYALPPIEDFEIYEEHASGFRNGVRYIIAIKGDTYASLSYYLNIREKKLRRYNDALDARELQEGDMVYIYAKKNRAGRKFTYCYCQPDDNLWEIAQKYGIRLKKLCKRNNIHYNSPTPQRLQLR